MTDTLSDVLRAVRLTGAFYFAIDGSHPWVVEAAPSSVIGPHLMPGADHVIEYHAMIEGGCWAAAAGEEPVWVEAGDIVAFPHGDPHVLSSAPGMRGGPGLDALFDEAIRLPRTIALRGGDGPRTSAICGFLGCDARPFNPLLATLPRVLHVRAVGGATLRPLIELALVESTSPRAGSACVLSRISELLFVEAVRRYAQGLPAESSGWFAGLRDPVVGRALERMHAAPQRAWTIEELAREVGASRSILAERFTHFVGVPPIQYLAQWRVQLAASLLRSTRASLGEIADRVGYGSEAALSRAFKRLAGVAPAAYRRGPET